jgi:hypothetical protein
MLNIIPVEPEEVAAKLEAKLVGVIQFKPVTDKLTEPSNVHELLGSTTTAEVERLQYKQEAASFIVAKGL